MVLFYFLFLQKILVLERGEGREEKKKRNIDQLAIWDQTHDLGMCPDQELDQQLFALQDNARLTKPHRSRQEWF